MRIAVFASGNGSNFQALVDYFKKNRLSVTIEWLFCDQPQAYVLQRAKKAQVAVTCLPAPLQVGHTVVVCI